MTLALAVAVFSGGYSIDPGGGVKPGGRVRIILRQPSI
jgi:hypothetical protein